MNHNKLYSTNLPMEKDLQDFLFIVFWVAALLIVVDFINNREKGDTVRTALSKTYGTWHNLIYIGVKIIIFVLLLQSVADTDIFSRYPDIVAGILFLVLFMMIIEPKVVRYIKQKVLEKYK